ncbi:restriction endonuclease subunit S [[Clostridium] colinum]|uniref:restriction endonuclease subunit S n=1 Tax=[Clostridium] colinum TaxID=36835 RepID=UPI00202517F5|nr:restriction endonuclease subunit S [[Clostridium] colinum]
MKHWKEVKLGDICDIIMGQSPKSEFYNNENKGIEFLQGNKTFGIKHPIYDTYTTQITKKALKNDIIMSVRAPVGDINITTKDICIGRGLCSLRMKNNQQEFLYYLLKNYSKELQSNQNGTVFGSINKNQIFNFKVLITTNIEEQKAIAKNLSCLDEKIELNNKINKNLEEMAQAIFKKWFIDFDYPLTDEEIANGGREFVDSELGKIPKSWRVGKLNDIIYDIIGGDWGKDKVQGNYIKNVFCIRGADIPKIENGELINLPNRFIINKNFENKKLLSNDIIIEISGGSPTQSTGRVTIIKNSILKNTPNLICTNFCRILRSKNNFHNFMYYYLKFIYNKGVMFTYENGTTGIKNLDVKNLLEKEVLTIPDIKIIHNFNIIIDAIKYKIIKSSEQNEKLAQIRDTLLPKLINGDVRVPY